MSERLLRATTLLILLAGFMSGGTALAQISGRAADTGLRVEWTVGLSKRGRTEISGYVYNDRDQWAANTRLRVELLDATGQVTGSTWISAVSDVPPRGRSYFEAPVPAGVAAYRATVGSVDWRGYGAAGGM